MRRGNSGNRGGYQYNYRVPKGAEPKHVALCRLESEGRLEKFRTVQREYRNGLAGDGRCMSRTKAFYAALRHFRPLRVWEL